MPLSLTQFLIFELGNKCNLGHKHKKCPNSLGLQRYAGLDLSKELDDATIVRCAIDAYLKYNFTGLIGWHYYNEPTLEWDRMLGVMRMINERVPQARYVLWTNGLRNLTTEDKSHFALIAQSDYSQDPDGTQLDNRMENKECRSTIGCLRAFVEFILDSYGNHHPCCYDWRGKASLGNVFTDGFDKLVQRWQTFQENIGGNEITIAETPYEQVPDACLWCTHRRAPLQILVPDVADRIKAWRINKCR